jgi:hypothetical protein
MILPIWLGHVVVKTERHQIRFSLSMEPARWRFWSTQVRHALSFMTFECCRWHGDQG